MENKDTTAHNPPPAYQTFPQQGQQVPPSVYPREAPPKYEEGLTSYQQSKNIRKLKLKFERMSI